MLEAAQITASTSAALRPAWDYEASFVPPGAPSFPSTVLAAVHRTIVFAAAAMSLAVPFGLVLGFLAGLWLAPRLDKFFPAMLLMLLLLPLAVVLTGMFWRSVPRALRNKVPDGSEIAVYALTLALTAWVCLQLNAGFEQFAFAGDFRNWLLETTGLQYEQRNAIVVGVATTAVALALVVRIREAYETIEEDEIQGQDAIT